jgi:hypothetical protein
LVDIRSLPEGFGVTLSVFIVIPSRQARTELKMRVDSQFVQDNTKLADYAATSVNIINNEYDSKDARMATSAEIKAWIAEEDEVEVTFITEDTY